MHERTQRGLSRLAFVACCALPTCLTLLAIIISWTPWHHRRQIQNRENHLALITGLAIDIDDYQALSPTTVRLLDVELTDPETDIIIANVRQIDWTNHGDRTSIFMQQPELHAQTFPAAWAMIHDRFLRQPEKVQAAVRFAASDLTIHSKQGTTITLRDVDAWIEPSSSLDAVHATVECLLASSTSTSPISISVQRDRRTGIPQTSWSLQTGDTALPCSALQDCFAGWWNGLGPQATFQGTMRAIWPEHSFASSVNHSRTSHDSGEKRLQLDLSGSTFDHVSLDRLFEKQNHRLSGLATIKFERCRLDRDQRVVDVSGSIRASEGLIGKSLLNAAVKHLDFSVQVPEGDEDIAFDLLAMRFSLLGSELKLRGACRQEINHEHFPIGVALGMSGVPIAATSPESLPSVRLMSVLAPSHSEWVPLAEQNQQLLWILLPPKHGTRRQRHSSTVQSETGSRTPLGSQLPIDAGRIRSARRYEGGPVVGQPTESSSRHR